MSVVLHGPINDLRWGPHAPATSVVRYRAFECRKSAFIIWFENLLFQLRNCSKAWMWLNITQEGLIHPSSKIWGGLERFEEGQLALILTQFTSEHYKYSRHSLRSKAIISLILSTEISFKNIRNSKPRCSHNSINASSVFSVDSRLYASTKGLGSNKERFTLLDF